MTKKVLVTYAALFLFAFTFAFAFGLASRVEAAGCCFYEWCYATYPPYLGAKGHMVKGRCVFTGNHPCDTAWICSEEGP